jgi:hypothetical protein
VWPNIISTPDRSRLRGWQRQQDQLVEIPMTGWISPRLGIRFEMGASDMEIYYPDGRQFLTTVEIDRQRSQAQAQAAQAQAAQAQAQAAQAQAQAAQAQAQAAQAQANARTQQTRAEQAEAQLQRTVQALLAQGMNPDTIAQVTRLSPTEITQIQAN